MALFKKLISVVKKFLRGVPSSHRKGGKVEYSPGNRKKGLRKKRKARWPQRPKAGRIHEKRIPVKKTAKPKPSKQKQSKTASFLGKPKSPQVAAQPPAGVLTGEVTHYFSKIMVVVVKITRWSLAIGNRIQIKGNITNFSQKVESLQIESRDVKVAPKGQLVGLKVVQSAKPGDKVFKLPV